ncbi:MAG: 2-hydroxychromene-2-carboxylate isomerase [Halioglobus sp.]|jgi:2-hydroxychromene-2-carboxylate isomerase
MSKTIEFYFDVGSPTAYLANKRLQQLCDEYGASLDYRPVLLGGIFKAAGNMSPVAVPAKGKYMMEQDLPRFAVAYGAPLNFNPYFPINTLNLMRGAIASRSESYFQTYLNAVFDAVWVEGKDMGDVTVVQEVLNSAGLDADALLAMTKDPEVKAKLIEDTQAAVDRGLFGVPTIFIDQQMFFGQDRMQFIESALRD